MIDENGHDEEHEDEALELELNTQSQIFLDMRQQNLDLLEIAARVAGYGGEHGPIKTDQLDQAIQNIWKIYAEFYQWIDPEESGDEEDEEE